MVLLRGQFFPLFGCCRVRPCTVLMPYFWGTLVEGIGPLGKIPGGSAGAGTMGKEGCIKEENGMGRGLDTEGEVNDASDAACDGFNWCGKGKGATDILGGTVAPGRVRIWCECGRYGAFVGIYGWLGDIEVVPCGSCNGLAMLHRCLRGGTPSEFWLMGTIRGTT